MSSMEFSESYRAVRKEMEPVTECPLCGLKPKTKVSFKGRGMYRNKRKTQVCTCGWSRIIPTEWEAMVQLGMVDDEL